LRGAQATKQSGFSKGWIASLALAMTAFLLEQGRKRGRVKVNKGFKLPIAV
jgi:hypothetical protein